MTTAAVETVRAGELRLAYRELGSGPPVLLVHGWPTSSYLWRDVMPPIARSNRVVAIDLPGFGASDKPPGAHYGFELFSSAIDGLLAQLGIDEVALAGHDIGGPIALHWTLENPGRATRLALLNTLVYPEFSDAVLEFVRACTTPDLREQLTSPQGLEAAMRLGLADESRLTEEAIAAVQEPFRTDEARRSLADAGVGLEVERFAELARRLPSLELPLRVVYGERDRILPDVAETMGRVARDVPHAVVTALPDCGHFLQEEAPAEVGELLAEFFRPS
ncbi:MAG TPA: alpha/beta fold hydrolase [Thermoleophilaceae bacterium]|jgi:haloalkane dehalogenase